MRKWRFWIVAVTCCYGLTFPVFADTTTVQNTDHAYINSDTVTTTVGTNVTMNLNFIGTSQNLPSLQIQTTLGSLNGMGSTVTLSPDNSGYQPLTLTSTKSGTATISVYENGTLIGTSQISFNPGSLGEIRVQSTPLHQVMGGSSTITITATDSYGNPVPDDTYGTSFLITTTFGQLFPSAGTYTSSNNNALTVTTHNGVAQAVLTSSTVGNAVLTVSDLSSLPQSVRFNGSTDLSHVDIPVKFDYSQSVTLSAFDDFKDFDTTSDTTLAAERELQAIGVLHGDQNHFYYPNSTMKRSEFAQVVAEYMGIGTLATNMGGSITKFTDVPTTAWYDGAVSADAAFGYVKGDGIHYYPDKTISYAEVAQILLNNLGIQAVGAWPNGAISTAQQYSLFAGVGSFTANQAATRGDVAVMVRNALHTTPPTAVDGGGLSNLNPNKTLESQFLGYTWNGDQSQAIVTAIPGSGTNSGNEIQVQVGGQTVNLTLASNVAVVGASTYTDLLNKPVRYLTNPMGVVTYLDVTQE